MVTFLRACIHFTIQQPRTKDKLSPYHMTRNQLINAELLPSIPNVKLPPIGRPIYVYMAMPIVWDLGATHVNVDLPVDESPFYLCRRLVYLRPRDFRYEGDVSQVRSLAWTL